FGMQDALAEQAGRILRTHQAQLARAAAPCEPAEQDQVPSDAQVSIVREFSGPVLIVTAPPARYEGSSLQPAIRHGISDYARNYTNPTYAYPPAYYAPGYWPGGYYGFPLIGGYPPPITRGAWPVYGGWYGW